jgi:hypothetical protein
MIDVILNDPGSGLWGLGAGWEMGLIAMEGLLREELPERSVVRAGERGRGRSLADQSSQAWARLLAER